MKKEDLRKLYDPDFHKSLGIELKWRIGDRAGQGKNVIYPYYSADQCREILDNVCGVDWYNEYREVNNKLFCTIGIYVDGELRERSNAGGPRRPRKGLAEEDKDAFIAKTAASSAFVRTAESWGIGRHIKLLPQVVLPTNGNFAVNPQTGETMTEDELAAYCNQITLPEGYLYSVYRLRKDLFDKNPKAMELMKELKELLTK